jgi:peptidoglycan/LPS O-acetylase OafA/YrhL
MLYGLWPLDHGFSAFENVGWLHKNFMGGFPRVAYGMTCGILLYRWFTHISAHKRFAATARFGKYSFLLYALPVAVFAANPKSNLGLYELFVLVIAAPAMVILGAMVDPREVLLVKAESFLGWISYPLYCLHLPIGVLLYFWGVLQPTRTSAVVCSLLVVAIAAIVCRFWDEPIRAFLSRRSPSAVHRAAPLTRAAGL